MVGGFTWGETFILCIYSVGWIVVWFAGLGVHNRQFSLLGGFVGVQCQIAVFGCVGVGGCLWLGGFGFEALFLRIGGFSIV